MKKALLGIGLVLGLAGCGVSQSQLKDINALLDKSKEADCETIRNYLGAIQQEVQKQIK